MRGAGKTARMAAKAIEIAHDVKKLVNVETKFKDHTIAVVPGNTANQQILNDLIQGDQDFNREGDAMKMKGVTIKTVITPHPTLPAVVRATLWVDKQPGGSTYNNYNVVAATNGAATVINSHKSHDSRFLTKVLYDRLIPVEAAGTPRVVKINIPIPEINGSMYSI